jgi:hypothetical protein
MIVTGGPRAFQSLQRDQFNLFIYGMGFETRSTKIVSYVGRDTKVFALKMPEMKIHSYERNVKFAYTQNHLVVENFGQFVLDTLKKIFERRPDGPMRIGFDVSSINRIMLVEILTRLARLCREDDKVEVFYCPAAYQEPDWQFPQIERMGPINSTFSIIDTDPSKPLCLIFGAGFEAGISMGMISQLEPRVSFCFWGTGVDNRFDRAVRRANFNFEFDGFNTKAIAYNIRDPKGAFSQLESVVYGLISDYRVIIIPLGPKLFTFLTALIGMTYLGNVAIWRVQYARKNPPDSLPGQNCVSSVLDSVLLKEFSIREDKVLSAG